MTLATAVVGKTTSERLFERYNTFSQRPTVLNLRAKATIFKALRRVLRGWLPADRSTPILDIACGEGNLLCLLRELGYTNLNGLDLSPENVDICHRLGLGFVQQFDALQLARMPGLNQCGAVFALDILEHLPRERAAGFLEQVRELLLPGGQVVIEAPNMGNLLAGLHLYYDLSHQFGLTEKTAVALLVLAGFSRGRIEVRAAWNATTPLGCLREAYLGLLHRAVWMTEGAGRPTIPTQNLLIRASVP
jgi:2-polyprenyl-3-methyl-5-hydroxy-6-metoxy-1,4-benzoquinol methylase